MTATVISKFHVPPPLPLPDSYESWIDNILEVFMYSTFISLFMCYRPIIET